MNVLKLPFETKIQCLCGCEFEFDINDIQFQNDIVDTGWYMTSKENRDKPFVTCPLCERCFDLEPKFNKNSQTPRCKPMPMPKVKPPKKAEKE